MLGGLHINKSVAEHGLESRLDEFGFCALSNCTLPIGFTYIYIFCAIPVLDKLKLNMQGSGHLFATL